VLVVEDEEVLADSIQRGLEWEGLAVDVALDGEEALEKAAVSTYDVVVLDRDLPVVHGDEVCAQLAARPEGPRILMLTAARSVSDRVDGLTLGADDYLLKPFAFGELVARVRALGRRSQPARPTLLRHGPIVVDPARHVAFRDGTRLSLTRKEFAVLEILVAADGAVVSAEELLEQAWDDHTDPFTNAVRMTVSKLRRKLGAPDLVETVVGVGYRLT
jgi:two-component system, OmpR family, response regulator VanR